MPTTWAAWPRPDPHRSVPAYRARRLPPWPSHGHHKTMAIERNNSFHLLLSDDELKLLKLLAENAGLNASDYLRMLIRSMPSPSTQVMQGMRLGAALVGKFSVSELLESYGGAKAAAEGPEEGAPKKRSK